MTDHTIAAADAAYAKANGDTSVIPDGMYCYNNAGTTDVAPGEAPHMAINVCPYWGQDVSKDNREQGYCAHLRSGDWEDEGPSMLWDMVKECQINDDAPEEDDAGKAETA